MIAPTSNEQAWASLTPARRRALMAVATGNSAAVYAPTQQALREQGFVDSYGALTSRGAELANWAVQTGRWSR